MACRPLGLRAKRVTRNGSPGGTGASSSQQQGHLGLGGLARTINEAQFDTDSLGASPDLQNKFMQPNRVVGLFNTIVDTPRLSGTRRYLFADPQVAPVLEVAFLDGQQEPFLELQNSWRVDGSEWKVRLDYGVSGIDFRGAVTDAGA